MNEIVGGFAFCFAVVAHAADPAHVGVLSSTNIPDPFAVAMVESNGPPALAPAEVSAVEARRLPCAAGSDSEEPPVCSSPKVSFPEHDAS